jgi:hypothetical protein
MNHPTKNIGNASARSGKRETFAAAKKERSNLADSINTAFVNRTTKDKINPQLEGVSDIVKPKKFSK